MRKLGPQLVFATHLWHFIMVFVGVLTSWVPLKTPGVLEPSQGCIVYFSLVEVTGLMEAK